MKRLLSIICICVLCITAQAQSVIGVTRTGQLGTIGDNLPFVNQYGQIVTSPALSPTGQSFDIMRPSIITNVDVTEVTKTSATTGGRLVYGGTSEVTECGVCYGTSNYPTLLNSHVAATPNANGEFTVTLTGLQPNTTYYVCAYATNAWGTSYGTTWSFTTRGDATISITGNTDSKTYNGREQSVTGYTVSIPEGVNISEDQISYSGTATAQGTTVGTYYMGLSADDFTCSNANYDVVFRVITDGSLTINRAELTIKADNATKIYGEANPTSYTATVTGLVDNFTPTYTVTRTEGEAAGTYTITAAGATEQGNYTVTYEPGTFTISKKVATVTAVNKSKVYGETDPELTATVEGAETLNYTLTRAEGEDVGDYTITVNLGSNPNYEVTATNGTFTISKKTATVTADNKSKVYGETDPELTATVEGAETLNYTLTRVAGETAGDYTITVNLGINPNYEVTAANGTFTISKKSATVTVDANQSKVYGAAEPTLTATVTGVKSGETLNYTLSRVEGENVGTYAISVTLGNNPNYEVTATNGTFAITKKSATVTVDANQSKVYGAAEPTLTATVSGIVGDDVLNYTLTRAEGEDVGDYAITVTLGNNPNYEVTATNGTFAITKKSATVTVDANQSKVYGAAEPTLTATVSGIVGDDVLNYSLTRAEGEDVGDYAITVTLGSNPNYEVTATNGTFTISPIDEVVVTITGNTTTATYDGESHTATGYSVVSISNPLYTANDFILSGGSAEVSRMDAGTSYMGLTQDKFKNTNENFTDVSFIVTDGYVTINKKAATVTADDKSKTYGAADPALTASVNGLVGTETLNYSLARAEGENAGDYTITVTLGSNPNYEVTAANGTFTINKATATVTADNKSKVYGETDPELTATVEGAETLNYTLTRAEGETAGDYTITVNLGSNPNYEVTAANGTFTINKKSATVTVDANQSKVYGSTEPTLTATVAGVVGNDALNYSLSRAAGESVGTYAITVTLGANPNYDVTATNGTFTITKATATVTADAKTKVYGDNDPDFTAEVSGLKNGDAASVISYTLNRTAGENVGTYAITPAGAAEQGNYNVTYVPADLTITKATATVTADAKTKVYGENDPAFTAVVSGLKNGDAASVISYSFSRASGENVGTYAITPSGDATQGNYNVTYVPANLTITKATATVTAVAKEKVYGAADPTFTATVAGLKNSDAASVITYTVSRAAGENVGTYAITPSGEATQGNYTVTYVSANLTITKATATVTADNKSKVVGENDPTLTATVNGAVGNDVLSYNLDREAGETVGTYAITVTLGENPNYNVTAHSGTFTITLPECPTLGTTTYTPNPVTSSATTITLTTPVNNLATGVSVSDRQYTVQVGNSTSTVTGTVSNGVMTGTITITTAMRNQSITVTPSVTTSGCSNPGTISGDAVEICVQPVLPSFGTVSNTDAAGKTNLFYRAGTYPYATINNYDPGLIQEMGFYVSNVYSEVQNHTCAPIIGNYGNVDTRSYGASQMYPLMWGGSPTVDPIYTEALNVKLSLSYCGKKTYYQPYMKLKVCGNIITVYGSEVKSFTMWGPESQESTTVFEPTISASPNPVSSGSNVTLTAESYMTIQSNNIGQLTIPQAFNNYGWALGSTNINSNNWTYRWEDENGNTIHTSHTSGTKTVKPTQTTTYTAYGEFTYGGETCRVSKSVTVTVQ